MSSPGNNLHFVHGNWRSGNESPSNYAWSRPNNRDEDINNSTYYQRLPPVPESWIHSRIPHPPPPLPYRPQERTSRIHQDPWRLFEDRVRTGPYNLHGFPLHPLSPMRIIVFDQPEVGVNPHLRQFIQDSPPRIQGQWNTQLTSDDDHQSKLSREEQKTALNKLNKQIYKPYPKNKTKGFNLYYRSSSFNKSQEEQDDESNSCAICLEEFVPKQEIMVTPCNHMFHEDCIVRWVKSNGQCPVCRYAIGQQTRETHNGNGNGNGLPVVNNNEATADLLSLIRAMEEAFQWVHVPR